MQNDPKKAVRNYNEVHSELLPHDRLVDSRPSEALTPEQQNVVTTGVNLVDNEVTRLLGINNRLTGLDLSSLEIVFVETDIDHPDFAGYYSSLRDRITIITGSIEDSTRARTKVFIHEYLHRLSHNGRDDNERVSQDRPIAINNNIGFNRPGKDIRKGREGQNTNDYFLSWNEAVTEQLAIDILPDAPETYDEYRGLLNQAIDDAVTRGLGSRNVCDKFEPWSRDRIKDYIYTCFFKGNHDGFVGLLKIIYKEYDISEQQFGLMTHKDDLPPIVLRNWVDRGPNDPSPTPSQIALMVQHRIDAKTEEDYVSDIIDIEPMPGGGSDGSQNKFGIEYDEFIRENSITISHPEVVDGLTYDIDTLGYVIYRGQTAEQILANIKAELDALLSKFARQEVDSEYISNRIDSLLFDTYGISMLSDGFREFYVYKHTKLEKL